ncbi:hypothetical protein VB711_26215 [Cronbergia sp. UHCC 0137]|uniref:hypothetical protein n=1 Tax=Cronbergia sp. UHCC 0137 TaxID=3110239 RepID=UPI002B21AD99|nr:hypothetical protein [Cronbergia sp. UHCC 0137]MEA5621304.1 hypothetical protein [Cronbergia sp. UHCC 0137]
MKFTASNNVVVIASALGLIGLIAGYLGISISFESTEKPQMIPTSTTPETVISAHVSNNETITEATPVIEVKQAKDEVLPPNLAYRVDSNNQTNPEGSLRMSNQTNQPVRLALLARQSVVKKSTSQNNKYNIPAHWDFSPQEGSEEGLILSLPQGNLQLEKGDVLVAFAQDGSRQYWGPYVVGETSSPQWNPQTKEWRLILNN